jgi:drug/metabolite transporter (DMT)-like permease
MDEERRKGMLVLLTVPVAWGTFEPAVRYVYEIQPDVPPFVFQFVYYLVAATSLCFLALSSPQTASEDDGPESETLKLLTTNTTSEVEKTTKTKQLVSFRNSLPIQGGLELGTYLFLGNGLQVVGLKTVPSDRAAFLLQITTIFVPLVQSLLARNLLAVATRTWIACFVALSGVACIGLDGGSNDAALSFNSLSFSIGDLYIALGAFFYTFHCIRLEGYAKKTPAVQLAAAKASTETMWCALVVLVCLFATTNDNPLLDVARTSGDNMLAYKGSFLASVQDPKIPSGQWIQLASATAWTGLVTIAYTIYAQSFGQSRVKPATANLIYTIQPFFTALVAFLVLGERLGPAGYVGGILIGSAVLLVIQEEDDSGATSTVDNGIE